jgi:hypothetical protein
MKLIILLGTTLLLTGCSNTPRVPAGEQGYRHLMKALKDRSTSSCENLEHDGTTCYRIKGHDLCGKTRDGAAEVAAMWIDNNIPIGCGDCAVPTLTFETPKDAK